jgi:ABC-type antimicrobial peptide transport system permease subunit
MTRGQSVGKLFLGSLVGIILGIVVFLIVASVMGQNPSWISTGFTLLWAVWGGTVGAAMAAWGEPR